MIMVSNFPELLPKEGMMPIGFVVPGGLEAGSCETFFFVFFSFFVIGDRGLVFTPDACSYCPSPKYVSESMYFPAGTV